MHAVYCLCFNIVAFVCIIDDNDDDDDDDDDDDEPLSLTTIKLNQTISNVAYIYYAQARA